MVVVRTVLKVHSESSVDMAQVVMVIQLIKGLVGQLRFAMEAFEDVITWDEPSYVMNLDNGKKTLTASTSVQLLADLPLKK